MTFPSAMVQTARDRAHKLDDDARAAVRELLDRRVKTDDAELARWARDHEDAGGLRDRWVRDLVRVATEATAPLWAEVDAYNARCTIREGLRYQEWAENGAPFDYPDERTRPEQLAEWRRRADDERRHVAEAEAFLAGYTRTMPGSPEADALNDEEGPETIYWSADETGRLWAVSVVLSSSVLTPETRADVWAKLDAETARREGDEARVAEVEASPNEWAPCFLSSAPWEWLGGTYDQPEPDDEPVPDGFEVASRWSDGAKRWRVIRRAGPPRYLRAFTRDLWRARWHGEAVEERRGPRYRPALVGPVHRDLGRAMAPRRGEANPAQMTLPGLVPALSAGVEAVRKALAAAAAASPTVAHRLVRWIVREAAIASSSGLADWTPISEKAVIRPLTAGAEIVINGGFDTLRQLLDFGKKGVELEAVVDIFAGTTVAWANEHDGIGKGVLLQPYRPPGSNRLTLLVSPLLCPGMASDKAVRVADRVLVPVLPPPPLLASNRTHGALLALDWAAVSRLSELRAQLRAYGGVDLDWPRLADGAGVRRGTLARALDLWTNPATGRWVELPGGLWRLADRGDEGRAHALLVEGAAMSAAGAEAGRRSVRSRQAARNRYGQE